MKNLAKYLILLLFVVATPVAADGPALWSIKDNDTKIYLFGTIHVLKPDTQWQNDSLMAKFSSSNKIITELSPEQMNPALIGPIVMQLGMYGADDSLKNHIDAEDYAIVEKSLVALGMPPQAVERFKPWMATITLMQYSLMQAGFNPESGVEMVLTKLGKAEGKSFIGLETAAEQMGFFANMEDDKQKAFLKSTINDMPEAEQQINDMLAAWLVGDMEKLDALMNEGMKEYPGLSELLIASRNKRWIKQIGTLLTEESGTLFLAVGAGHMPGEDGVINLLKKAGYEVTRVE